MRNDFCSNYLEHSAKGTTWKKRDTKYIHRVWKNGKWVYYYKPTAEATGSYGAKMKSQSRGRDAIVGMLHKKWYGANRKNDYDTHKAYKDAERYGRRYAQQQIKDIQSEKYSKQAESEYRKARPISYYSGKIEEYIKSGKIEKAVESGKQTISKILDSLKPQETITITSNLYPAGTKKVIKKK